MCEQKFCQWHQLVNVTDCYVCKYKLLLICQILTPTRTCRVVSARGIPRSPLRRAFQPP
jgi:hypothetical protein